MGFAFSKKLSEFIWINGSFIPWDEAKIHVLTHSLHYSGSVYEGERSYGGKVFKLEEHTERLLKSAEYMRLKVNSTAEEINKATNELLLKNNIKDGYIRPLIWRGAEAIGVFNAELTTNIMIMATQSSHPFKNGLNINISPWRKAHKNSLPPQCKSSAHYAMATAILDMATLAGYDDSLFLDLDGNIAECTVANIFFGKQDDLVTPIADGFLNGITRQTVIEIAKGIGIKVKEMRLTIEDIAKYDTCFITGTSKEIKGVSSIDLGEKKLQFLNDSIVESLQYEFAKLVRKEIIINNKL